MNILRRLPLPRLLLLCALVLVIGVSATALALAIGSGPTPPPKPLAQAIHDALGGTGGEQVQGVSASVTLTDHLLEGANLATGGHGGELTSSPLITGASGRLWIARDGHVRLELQSQQGDTQVIYDGHTLSLYDAATNTLYRYTPSAGEGGSGSDTTASDHHEVPTVARIEEAIARLGKHADVSGATPTDVAGHPAYTVRVSPDEGGSLFGAVELSWDAGNGMPLRAAVYSTTSASPVIELAATEVSYGPVERSTLEFAVPASAKVEEVTLPARPGAGKSGPSGAGHPRVTIHGQGLAAIVLVESPVKAPAGGSAGSALEGLPKVEIDGVSASELPTALGTLLSFERADVHYLLAGSVTPGAIEAFARGL